MAVLFGSYTIPLLGVSIFIAALTYITYKMLSSYLQKWFEMKPIPQVEGTYLFIGNALTFKTNAGGKRAIDMLLPTLICVQFGKAKTIRHSGTHYVQTFKLTDTTDGVPTFALCMHRVFKSPLQISFVKFKITPVSSVMRRCLNSGLAQSPLWFCFMLKLLR